VRRLLLAALLLPAFPAARAQDEEAPALQRYLISLQLGDGIEDVRRIYPPAQEWPTLLDPRGVTRYKVERDWTKFFPKKVQTFHVGFKKGRLVEIQVVYDEKFSKSKTYEQLAAEFALIYGEPHRSGDRFWWSDSNTVLRVFPAELSVLRDGEKVVEWRTSVQVYEKSVFKSLD